MRKQLFLVVLFLLVSVMPASVFAEDFVPEGGQPSTSSGNVSIRQGSFLQNAVNFLDPFGNVSDNAQNINTSTPTNPFVSDLQGSVSQELPSDYTSSANASPFLLIARIVRILLSFLGIGTIILMTYAGFLWMTSGGSDDKISQAKALIRNAVIGLIIIMSAYSITSFVIRRLYTVTARQGYLYLQR